MDGMNTPAHGHVSERTHPMDLSIIGGNVVHVLGVRRIHPSDVMSMSGLVPLMLCRFATGGSSDEDVKRWGVLLTDVMMGREDLWFIEHMIEGSNHNTVCGYARGCVFTKASEYQLVVCVGGTLIKYDPPGWRAAIYGVERQIRQKGMLLPIRLTVWSTTVKELGTLEGHVPVGDATYYLLSADVPPVRSPSTKDDAAAVESATPK